MVALSQEGSLGSLSDGEPGYARASRCAARAPCVLMLPGAEMPRLASMHKPLHACWPLVCLVPTLLSWLRAMLGWLGGFREYGPQEMFSKVGCSCRLLFCCRGLCACSRELQRSWCMGVVCSHSIAHTSVATIGAGRAAWRPCRAP